MVKVKARAVRTLLKTQVMVLDMTLRLSTSNQYSIMLLLIFLEKMTIFHSKALMTSPPLVGSTDTLDFLALLGS